jgi:CheY-like chemotaxis protein
VGESWPRSCSCGRTWSERDWQRLSQVGFFPVPGGRAELRECTCGATISVPLGPRDEGPRRQTSRVDVRELAAATTKPHVLVVDDDPLVHRALSRALEGSWRTSNAESGAALVRALSHGARFDIILLDVELPDVTVEQAYARITKIDPALAPRVVFMTGGESDENRKFLGQIDNACLRKPFPFKLLHELLEVILHKPAAAAASS